MFLSLTNVFISASIAASRVYTVSLLPFLCYKHDRYLTGTIGEYLEFVPVCPEVEAGFPIPRETFRLVGDPENPRFMTTRTQVDHTERMAAWAEKRVRELEQENLCGFIFKSDSPSSGLERVKVYNAKGMAEKYDQPYLKQQVYLNPRPLALKLRNHA